MMTGQWLSCSHWFKTPLGFAFFLLKCSRPYLPGTVSPDCLGNSPLPSCDQSGQGLEQLNRRDKQSLIQTAMQNMQADASENVPSGYLDFKLHLIKLKWGGRGVWRSWTATVLPSDFLKTMSKVKSKINLLNITWQTWKYKALLSMGCIYEHLSFPSVVCAAERWKQPFLIKTSEQSHACRCLQFLQRTSICLKTCIKTI